MQLFVFRIILFVILPFVYLWLYTKHSPMKKTFLYLVLIIVTCASCKKSGLKNINVQARHMNIPAVGLPLEFSTQAIQFDIMNFSDLRNLGLNQIQINNKLRIPDYILVDDGARADFILKPTIGTGVFESKGIITNTRKDTTGKEYKTYNVAIDYGNRSAYSIYDHNNRLIDEIVLESEINKTRFSSSEFSRIEDANNWWQTQSGATTERLRREVVQRSLDLMSNQLRTNYAVYPITSRVAFKSIKDTEIRESRTFNEIGLKAQSAFGAMTAQSTAKYQELILPCIEGWLALAEKFDYNDEKERNMKFACIFNVALAYYWMDDFESARRYAGEIGSGMYNLRDGDRLLEDISNLEYRLNRLGVSGQHFVFPNQKRA